MLVSTKIPFITRVAPGQWKSVQSNSLRALLLSSNPWLWVTEYLHFIFQTSP